MMFCFYIIYVSERHNTSSVTRFARATCLAEARSPSGENDYQSFSHTLRPLRYLAREGLFGEAELRNEMNSLRNS